MFRKTKRRAVQLAEEMVDTCYKWDLYERKTCKFGYLIAKCQIKWKWDELGERQLQKRNELLKIRISIHYSFKNRVLKNWECKEFFKELLKKIMYHSFSRGVHRMSHGAHLRRVHLEQRPCKFRGRNFPWKKFSVESGRSLFRNIAAQFF